MTVTVDTDQFRRDLVQHFSRVADDAVQAMFLDMEQNGPRSDLDHDHMTSIVELVSRDDGEPLITRTIRSPAEYSSFVDEGTSAHPIVGNPLLAFTWHGRKIIVHSVNHPGTAATHWWSERLANWGDYVAAVLG